MNVLSKIHFEPLANLQVSVGELSGGWMDFTLKGSHKEYAYSASYLSDPINDLLNRTLLLLQKKPVPLWYSPSEVEGSAYIVHKLEPSVIDWLLIYTDDALRVLIWKDSEIDLIEDICWAHFDEETYVNQHAMDDLPDLREGLLFAFEGNPEIFVEKLLDICKEIKNLYGEEVNQLKKICPDDVRVFWGITFSQEAFDGLQTWLNSRTNK